MFRHGDLILFQKCRSIELVSCLQV